MSSSAGKRRRGMHTDAATAAVPGSQAAAATAEKGRWGLKAASTAPSPPLPPPRQHTDTSREDETSSASLLVDLVDTMDPAGELPELDRKDSTTFERLLVQSDVNSDTAGLLVDRPRFRNNWKLWRSLLVFRKRLHGDDGVKDVWEGMQRRGVDLPTTGEEADRMWRIFLATALRDDSFAEKLIEHALDLSARSNHQRQWAPLYDEFMLHHLVSLNPDTLTWHLRLFPIFSSRNFAALFSTASMRQDVPKIYFLQMRVHATIQNPGIYTAVITDLCGRGKFEAAAKWNRHLLLSGDLPPDSSIANSLIAWTAKTATYGNLRQMFKSFNKAGVALVESSAVAAVEARRASMEAVNIIYEKDSGFKPETLGDMFWGSLFDTSMTTTEVFSLALDYGIDATVGYFTVEKASCALQRGHSETIEILGRAGFNVSIPQPPTPSTPQNQHSHSPLDHHTISQNDELQLHLCTRNISRALNQVELMLTHTTPFSQASIWYLSRTFLRPRRQGHNPTTLPFRLAPGKDVDLVIRLFLRLQQAGNTIPWHLWSELIRRLGKDRRREELERLVFTLISTYRCAETPVRSAESPLRKLFGPTTVRAIVEWGFLSGDVEWTWGVALVRRMRELGVHVDDKSVKRAVRVRIRRVKPKHIGAVVQLVEEVWGGPLWRDAEELAREIEELAKEDCEAEGREKVREGEKGAVTDSEERARGIL